MRFEIGDLKGEGRTGAMGHRSERLRRSMMSRLIPPPRSARGRDDTRANQDGS